MNDSSRRIRVLVAGAGGYLGARFVRSAPALGIEAIPLRSGAGIVADSGMLAADWRLPPDVEAVLFLAQSPHYRDGAARAAHLLRVNQCLAADLAVRAAAAGVRRFVYASTGSVYAPAFAPFDEDAPLRRDDWYALSKVHAEEALALLRASIEVCVLRLFGIYGPGQTGKLVPNLVRRIRSGGTVTVEPNPHDSGDRDGLRISLCHVDDLGRILARIAREGAPPVLNVAAGEVTSVRALATAIGGVLGVTPRIEMGVRPRAGDLVADNRLLVRTLAPTFVPLAAGLADALADGAGADAPR